MKKPTGRSYSRDPVPGSTDFGPGTVRRVCGRYVTVSSPALLAERFHVTEIRPRGARAELQRRPPGRRAGGGRAPRRTGARRVALGPGAVLGQGPEDRRPHDQRPRRDARSRATPSSGPFERRRCIVPADGFYEWEKRSPGSGRSSRGSSGAATVSRSRSRGSGSLARPQPRRRRAAAAHVHDHHDRRPTSCSRRSTTACRSCCRESAVGHLARRRQPRHRGARDRCSCRCPRASSKRGRSRRS